MFCNPIRSMKRADTWASMSSRPQPPCLFDLCSVDIDTKNVAPYHMYHATAVVNCRAQVVGTGNTWAVCQILARRYVCTYRIRWERCKSRPYVSLAWALTCLLLSPVRVPCLGSNLPVTFAQLLFIDCSMVLVKVTLESLIRCVMVCTVQPWMYSILPLLMPSISLCSSVFPFFRSNVCIFI